MSLRSLMSLIAERKTLILDLLVLVAFSAVPFLFYGSDLIFASFPQVHIDPSDLLRLRLYMWESRISLGHDIGYSMGDLPMVLFFVLFSSLGLPMFIVGRLWMTFIVFLHGASMYYLASVVIPRAHRFAKMTAALSYMYSLYLILTIHGATDQLTISGILPVMLGLYIRGMSTQHHMKYAMLLGLASSVMGGVVPPLSAIIIFVLATYFLFHTILYGLKNVKTIIRFNAVASLFVVLVNLYWIVPAIHFWGAAWIEPVFFEPLALHNRMSSFSEIFRLLGFWGFYSGYNGVPYYSFSTPYIRSPLLIATTFLAPIVALSSLFLKRKNKYVLFFGLLVIFLVPMAVATYPPENPSLIGRVYLWAYHNVPFFRVFRMNYRFVIPLSLAYSAMTGFLTNALCVRDSKGGRTKVKKALVFLILSMILINSWPLWTGNEFEERLRIKEIPSYWYEAADWMNSLDGDFKILCLPQQYFSVYTWGKPLGSVTESFFKRPQISMQGGVSSYSPFSAALTDFVYDEILRNSTQDFSRILGLMNVEYILQRNDFDWTYYSFVDSPSHVKTMLNNQRGIHLEKTFGKLDFYKINYSMPHIYASDHAVYVEGNIDVLIQLASIHDFPILSSVLFFSEVMQEQNNFTLPLANQVVYKSQELRNSGVHKSNASLYEYYEEFRNSGDTTERFGKNNVNKGKFFEQGARGHINYVKAYTKNVGNGEGNLTLGFTQYPGGPDIFEVDVRVPAASHGWFSAKVDRFWDFDSIFVYIKADPYIWVGVDYSYPWDDYYSNDGVNWLNHEGRRYISLVYTRTLVLTSVKNNLIPEPPAIDYQELSPTKYLIDVDAVNPFFLVFSESYHTEWKAYIDGEEVEQHFLANGYANSWYVNKTGRFRIILEYVPQRLYDLSKAASLMAFTILLALTIFPPNMLKQKFQHALRKLKRILFPGSYVD